MERKIDVIKFRSKHCHCKAIDETANLGNEQFDIEEIQKNTWCIGFLKNGLES